MQACMNASFNAKCAGFYASLLISVGTLIFCFIQLFKMGAGEDRSVYVGIVATIIGVWLPSPQLPGINGPRGTPMNSEVTSPLLETRI